jgi:hypothetical protein
VESTVIDEPIELLIADKRGRDNVFKQVLIHAGALNLSLIMRKLLGKGTPRGFQGYSTDAPLALLLFWKAMLACIATEMPDEVPSSP